MARPVCVKCKVEYICEKNEFVVTWTKKGRLVYQKNGDKFKCPKCEHEIVVGFGSPIDKELFNTDLLIEI